MRAVFEPGAWTETLPLIELRSGQVVCTQIQLHKVIACRGNDSLNKQSSDAQPAEFRKHVHSADTANIRCRCKWIPVQAAESKQATIQTGGKKAFTRLFKTIGGRMPFINKPSHESEAFRLALGEMLGQLGFR